MKTTFKTAAQSMMLLAACVAAVAQSEIAPDHFPDQAVLVASAPRQEAQVRPLQTRLEDYEKLLQAKREQVEDARQEAISAGIRVTVLDLSSMRTSNNKQSWKRCRPL